MPSRPTMPLRRPFLLLAATAALAIASCGDDDDQTGDGGGDAASVQTLRITADSKGALTVPAKAAPGATKITLDNRSKGDAEAQFVRIEGNHSAEEALGALGLAISGKPWKDFFYATGGVGMTGPGESLSVTQELDAGGTYYVVNASGGGRPGPDDLHKLEIGGQPGAKQPKTDAVVSATEYEFAAEGLSSGSNQVTFDNAGARPITCSSASSGTAPRSRRRRSSSYPTPQGGGSGPFPLRVARRGQPFSRAARLRSSNSTSSRKVRPLLLHLRS